jgi:ABC-type xylose transport system permease subunit
MLIFGAIGIFVLGVVFGCLRILDAVDGSIPRPYAVCGFAGGVVAVWDAIDRDAAVWEYLVAAAVGVIVGVLLGLLAGFFGNALGGAIRVYGIRRKR